MDTFNYYQVTTITTIYQKQNHACLYMGGITWTPEYGKLADLPNGCFIGFDTAHAGQPPFSQQTVMDDCMELIKQIIKRNEEEN